MKYVSVEGSSVTLIVVLPVSNPTDRHCTGLVHPPVASSAKAGYGSCFRVRVIYSYWYCYLPSIGVPKRGQGGLHLTVRGRTYQLEGVWLVARLKVFRLGGVRLDLLQPLFARVSYCDGTQYSTAVSLDASQDNCYSDSFDIHAFGWSCGDRH